MSQSIRADRISESTIARIAGNLLSGDQEAWKSENSRPRAVYHAVATARDVAAEVERTKPKGLPAGECRRCRADVAGESKFCWQCGAADPLNVSIGGV